MRIVTLSSVMNVHGRWRIRLTMRAAFGWARDFFHASAPFASSGVYVNFLTADEGERVGAATVPTTLVSARVKRRYDPENLFRVNQNIKPA